MKFAKQLGLRSIPSWAPYYLDYKSLKHYIKTSFKEFDGNDFQTFDLTKVEMEPIVCPLLKCLHIKINSCPFALL